ncbi:MAG TPA: DUF5777 family beta-barrel protein [Thermoanaerobaculia bacterium]|jgi:hypothetical protein|nr:DUF5777 family beta-barrel protein [Thermoanaerobaculia bacterium]
MTRLAIALLIALPLIAQDETPALRPLPMGDVLLSLPSNQIAPHGQWEVKFTHRFNQSLDEGSFSDQLHSLFGLDTNADVVFGVAYAMRPNLQISVARSNVNDTLEAAAKYVVLRQTAGSPLSLTLRGGTDVRTERDLEDRTSFFAQAIVTRQFGRKAEVFFLPTIATNAGRALSGDESVALFDHAFNMPIGFAWVLRPGLTAVIELTPPNGDLPDEMDGDFAWAVGVKRNLGGHWFEILLTNSQTTMVDQYVTTTFQGSPLEAGSLHLGFNIERRFGKRK